MNRNIYVNGPVNENNMWEIFKIPILLKFQYYILFLLLLMEGFMWQRLDSWGNFTFMLEIGGSNFHTSICTEKKKRRKKHYEICSYISLFYYSYKRSLITSLVNYYILIFLAYIVRVEHMGKIIQNTHRNLDYAWPLDKNFNFTLKFLIFFLKKYH